MVEPNNSWQLQQAKSRLSEVVEKALVGESQVVTRHGKKVVVVLSYDQYEKLSGNEGSILDVLRRAPSFEGLDLSRDKRPTRQEPRI